jgi:hypothetical protein
MISKIVLILFFSIAIHLNAVGAEITGGGLESFTKELEILKGKHPPGTFDIHTREDVSEDVKDCSHCPGHMKLTNSVNNILSKLSEDPRYDEDNLPMKVNKLKMLYYVTVQRDNAGNVKCDKISNYRNILDPDAKMMGEAKLIAEDFFSISATDSLYFNNIKDEKIVYYFRDESKKNVLVQVILEKNKSPVIQYYSYTPSSEESKGTNLPSLGAIDDDTPRTKRVVAPVPEVESNGNSLTLKPTSIEGLSFKYEPKLEKKGILPRNYHIGDASLSKEIFEGYHLNGNSHLSLADGTETSLNLKNTEREILMVKLKAKLNGQTEHMIVVPYQVKLGDESSTTAVKGSVQDETHATTLSLSLADNGADIARVVARQNKDTGNHSVVISRDFVLSPKESINVSGGRDETAHNFVALRHLKTLNKSTYMAVDLKIDSERKATMYYTLTSRF